MIAVAAIWLFLCIPQCFLQNSTSEVAMGVHNESLKLTEKEAKESHGQTTEATVSIEGNLKSDSKEVPPEAKTLIYSSNVDSPSLLTENDSEIVANNYHNSESQTTTSTRSYEESPVSDMKIPEIFAPKKDKHKKHDEIKPIHKLESIDPNSPSRVTLIEHTASIHVQEAKVQVGIPKDNSDGVIKTDKTDKNEDLIEIKKSPDSPEVQETIEKVSFDEKILEKSPEPPESSKPSQTVELPSDDADNMPSFNEWTQKRLAEQEQKGSNIPPSTSSQGKTTPVSKMRQKNYASADCGAKILGTNPEAQSAYAVLNGYHDEYMLNPCTAKIWLVIELCEPIQAKKIEVANFELFSSSPREFSVSSSDRFPSRDWVALGTFEAKEEKNIQSFSVDQKSFHKYIKIELFSHYGSEHYCPLSLVRLYGTSELELLDNDDDHTQPGGQDLDGDGLPDDYETPGEPQSPNLFGSAKDAVMSIVKKAAEALSRDKNAQEVPINTTSFSNATQDVDSDVFLSNLPNMTDQCVTIVQSTVEAQHESNVSSDETQDAVEKMLSCSYHFLTNLLKQETVNEILNTCSLCNDSFKNASVDVSHVSRKCLYLHYLIGPVRFLALCNLFKINRSLMPLNTLTEHKLYPNVTELTPGFETLEIDVAMSTTPIFDNLEDKSTSTSQCESAESSSPTPEIASETPPLPDSGPVVSFPDLPNGIVNSSQSLKELIQPTKTLKPDDIGGDVVGASEESVDSVKSSVSTPELVDNVERSEKESKDKIVIEDGAASIHGDSDTSSASSSIDSLLDLSDKTQTESTIIESTHIESLPTSELTSTSEGSETPFPTQSSLPSGSKKDISSPTSSVSGSNINKTSPVTTTSNTQKESVFVRLTNRIKALEMNMSFSSQYLEELSQRYRKQMEEMQRAFNKTISALNETAKKAQEQDVKQQEIINSLQSQIDNLSNTVDLLLADRESLGAKILEPHVFIIFVELMLAAFMYALLKRHSARYLRSLNVCGDEMMSDSPENNLVKLPHSIGSEGSLVKRRNSFSGNSSSYNKPQRRPSEEALNISGTYADLMIVEPVIPIMVDQPKVGEGKRKKQRHKKNSRDSIDGTMVDTVMNFPTNLNRKQSVGKLAKTAGSLHSENRNIKCDRTNNLLVAHNNLKTTSCQETDIRWNCAKKRTTATSGANKKCCCPFNSTGFVRKTPSELLCNGIESRSKNNKVVNGSCVSGVKSEDTSDDFVLKKFLIKWFWWLRR